MLVKRNIDPESDGALVCRCGAGVWVWSKITLWDRLGYLLGVNVRCDPSGLKPMEGAAGGEKIIGRIKEETG